MTSHALLGIAALLVVHGLLHLLGFARAFGLVGVPSGLASFSKAQGVLWLLTAFSFVVAGSCAILLPRLWWQIAIPALVASQVLIATSWNDAKLGTLVNLMLLVPVSIAAANALPSSFRSRFEQEVARATAARGSAGLVAASDLAHLPAAVRRYIEYSGAIGKPKVYNFRARFRGQIRSKPDGGWMNFEAEQYDFLNPSERLFFIRSSLYGLPFDALHLYIGPSATMQVKVLGLITVVDARGPEMNRSETVTLFNDMCILAPATLIDPRIRWQEVDARSVVGTFSNANNEISAVLSFNTAGELVEFVSEDRFQTADGKEYRKYRWSTPVRDYRKYNGRKVASFGQASWAMPAGELEYGRFELVEIDYNVQRVP